MRHPPKCYQRSGGNSTQTKSFDDSYRTHTLYEDFLLFARETLYIAKGERLGLSLT